MATFMIDSDAATPQPQDMQHAKPQVVATKVNGDPVVMGYPALQVSYELLTYAQMAKLESLYDPLSPSVTVTYPSPSSSTGQAVTKNAKMQPIEYGGRTAVYFTGVTLKFTRLT